MRSSSLAARVAAASAWLASVRACAISPPKLRRVAGGNACMASAFWRAVVAAATRLLVSTAAALSVGVAPGACAARGGVRASLASRSERSALRASRAGEATPAECWL
jgi:branched-subunit amino acid ABC-type transport system permease component